MFLTKIFATLALASFVTVVIAEHLDHARPLGDTRFAVIGVAAANALLVSIVLGTFSWIWSL